MFKNEGGFKKIVDRLNIDNKPNPAHREKLRSQMLSEFDKSLKRSMPRIITFQTIERTIVKSKIIKFAAAAVIIVVISLFIVHQGPGEKTDTVIASISTKSTAELLTVASLNMAYRRGGIKAVEQQFEEAVDKLGPWPAKITVKQLLAEFNGT